MFGADTAAESSSTSSTSTMQSSNMRPEDVAEEKAFRRAVLLKLNTLALTLEKVDERIGIVEQVVGDIRMSASAGDHPQETPNPKTPYSEDAIMSDVLARSRNSVCVAGNAHGAKPTVPPVKITPPQSPAPGPMPREHRSGSVTSEAVELMNEGKSFKKHYGTTDLAGLQQELGREVNEGGHLKIILEHLKGLQVRHELKARRTTRWSCVGLPTMHPESPAKSVWDLVFALVLVFVCFKEPLHIAFPELFETAKDTWEGVEIAADTYFFLDMAVNAFTGYFRNGTLITTQPEVIRHYLLTWFVPDILSTFPFHRVFAAADSAVNEDVLRLAKFIRLLKLFKLLRLVRSSQAISRRISQSHLAYIAHPALIRMFNLCCGLILSWHCIACLWWFLRSQALSPNGDEAINFIPVPTDGEYYGLSYIESYYWAVSVTTGIGVPVLPASHAEAIFDGFCTFLGILLQAYMLGSAASALHTIDANKAAQQQKVDAVKQYMRSKRVPLYLREKIIDFFEYLYTRVQSIDEGKVLKHLPFALHVQLSVVLNQNLLLRMPLFKYIEPTCAAVLVLALQPALYLPFEVVITERNTNDTLYFLRSGKAEVIMTEESSKKIHSKATASPPKMKKQATVAGNVGSRLAAKKTAAKSRWAAIEKALHKEKSDQEKEERVMERVMERDAERLEQAIRRASVDSKRSSIDVFQTQEDIRSAMNSLATRYCLDQTLPSGFTSIAILNEGDSFGEQSFLNDDKPSLSSVVTLDYCELMKLKRNDFQSVLEWYPELNLHVEGYKRDKIHQYNEMTRKRSEMMNVMKRGSIGSLFSRRSSNRCSRRANNGDDTSRGLGEASTAQCANEKWSSENDSFKPTLKRQKSVRLPGDPKRPSLTDMDAVAAESKAPAPGPVSV